MHKTTVLGVCAASSNAGKTTLITRLIPALHSHNIRVSVIKHAHHQFDIDHPGKDSYRIREAGAVQTLIASYQRWALMTEMSRVADHSKASHPDEANQDETNLETLIQQINPDYADLILVEGFKNASIPKIEVYRASLNAPLLAILDPSIIAVASDGKLEIQPRLTVPVLDLNNIESITNFILQTIILK